jgi:glutamate dehydrogenase
MLAQMTDDVAALVLRDNYFQTQVLSVTNRLGVQLLDQEARFIRFLEKSGRLDRAIEFLPGDDELAERRARGVGLATPERAVLLAYCKMWLSDELMASDLPEDPWIATALQRYFPALLRDKFGALIPRHPLRREIIATHVLNSMVNRVGSTFVHRLMEMTSATPPQIVRAYLATREVFGYVAVWQQIEALDSKVPDEVQSEMILELDRLTTRATTWFLRSRRLAEPMEHMVERFRPAVGALRPRLEGAAEGSDRVARWVAAGVPPELARRIDATDGLFTALDIAEIADSTQSALADTAQVHFGVDNSLGLQRLRWQIQSLPIETYWQNLAKVALADDLADLQRSVAQHVVSEGTGAPQQRLQAWQERNRAELERVGRLLAELAEGPPADLAMLSVALRELRNLA